MSRMRQDIERQITEATTDNLRWASQLRLVQYLARSGQLEKAREIASVVRHQSGTQQTVEVLALLNVAESLLAFYDGRRSLAVDKIRRAEAIGMAGGARPETMAVAFSWDAHFQRNDNRLDALTVALSHCLRYCSKDNSEAISRLSLVVADAYQQVGDTDSAGKWYRAAHAHALVCGDNSLIAALIHNRAALRLFSARVAMAAGEPPAVDDYTIALEEASARSYESLVRTHSLAWFLDLIRGQVYMLQGRYEEALALLEGERVLRCSLSWREGNAMRMADVAFCRSKLYSAQSTRDLVAEVVEGLCDVDDPADRIVILDRVQATARNIGDDDLQRQSRERLQLEMHVYASAKSRWLTAINGCIASTSAPTLECIFGLLDGQ